MNETTEDLNLERAADGGASTDRPTAAPPASLSEDDVNRIADALVARIPAAPAASHARQDATPDASPPFDPMDELASRLYLDPKGTLQRHGQMVAQAVLQQIAPLVTPVAQSQAAQELSEGLDEAGREFVRKLAPQINPAALTAESKDLIRRAARDFQREKSGKDAPAAVAGVGSSSPPVDPDEREAVRGFNAVAKELGIDGYDLGKTLIRSGA